jgi:hypothetical protein
MQWQYMANRPIVNIITKSIHAAIGYILICIINLLILTANILIWNVADDQITKESLTSTIWQQINITMQEKKSLADGRKKNGQNTRLMN